VLHDLRQLGPLLEDGLQQLALLQRGARLDRQGLEHRQVVALEAVVAAGVVDGQRAGDAAAEAHRRRQAGPPAFPLQQHRQLGVGRAGVDQHRVVQARHRAGQGLLPGRLDRGVHLGDAGAAAPQPAALALHHHQVDGLRLEAAARLRQELGHGLARIDRHAERVRGALHPRQALLVRPHRRVHPRGPVDEPQRQQEQRRDQRCPIPGRHEQQAERQVESPAEPPSQRHGQHRARPPGPADPPAAVRFAEATRARAASTRLPAAAQPPPAGPPERT